MRIMNKKALFIFFATIFLLGCHTTYKKPPINDPSDDASIKLAEAADSVSDSMIQMVRVTKVMAHNTTKSNLVRIPSSAHLQTRASVDWAGPIAEVTDRVARAAHESLAEILRNIDYQAGKKASIYVYPDRKIIELRYAKFYS
jgi:defect-in-organelle-trafficking protein DotD